MRQAQSQLPEGLADRGIGVQAIGFTLTGCACLAILQLSEGNDFWLYQWFERATVDLYWSFIVPLAALFDWGRKMFERGKAIREAKKAEIEQKARQDGLRRGLQEGMQQGMQEGIQQGMQQGIQQGIQQGSQQENQRIKELLASYGVTLPPEIAGDVFGAASPNGS